MATFQNVRINQLGPEATRWLHEVLTALDAKDVDAYTGFMADDVEVSFNNGDMTMRGRDAVRDGLAQFWQSFGTLAHDELNIDGTDRNLVHESAQLLHDARRAGGDHSGGGMVDRDDDGNVVSLRIYNDQSPLWDQPAASR